MLPISATSPMTPAASLAGAAGSSGMGRDAFLHLLVTQLRNQDPTSPQSGSDFAAQLAQFSSVEQLTQISQAMAGQGQQLGVLAQALMMVRAGQAEMAGQLSTRIDLQSASGLIGQTVQVASPAVAWDGAGPTAVNVHLGGDAREVEVTLRNASGDVVRVLRVGAHDAGTHAIAWDGAGADGQPLPPGTYTASVSATGAEGASVAAAPTITGRVDRITVEGDGVFLWVGGQRISFNALLTVESGSLPPPAPAPVPTPSPAPPALPF